MTSSPCSARWHLPGLELLARVGREAVQQGDDRLRAAVGAEHPVLVLVQLDEHRATCHTVALLHVDGPDGGVVR